MRMTRRILNGMVTALTAAVLLLAAIVTVPKAFGITPCVVLSGSMEPVIQTGAVAYINTKDIDCLPGDIGTFKVGETMVTHRVIRIEGDRYVTKGDANDVEDLTAVTKEQMVGTYLFQIPKLGYLLARLDRKMVILIMAWICLLNVFMAAINRVFGNEGKGHDSGNGRENFN